MTCSSSTISNPDPASRGSRRRSGRRLAFALAVLILPLALSSSPGLGERSQSEALIDAARAALTRGDGIDSEMKLRAALAKGAQRKDVAAWMGKAYLEQKNYDKAREWLGRVGYDPVYGARPLKRAVQKYLQDPLADLILKGEVKDGSTVKVDEGDGGLVLTPA